jgi:hypothetical protein
MKNKTLKITAKITIIHKITNNRIIKNNIKKIIKTIRKIRKIIEFLLYKVLYIELFNFQNYFIILKKKKKSLISFKLLLNFTDKKILCIILK